MRHYFRQSSMRFRQPREMKKSSQIISTQPLVMTKRSEMTDDAEIQELMNKVWGSGHRFGFCRWYVTPDLQEAQTPVTYQASK